MKKVLLFVLITTLAPLGWSKDPEVIIRTSMGDITLRLFADKAPITVENFLSYVDSGYYEGTIFHRVISNFMIQGGGFLPSMQEKPGALPPIVNEAKNRIHNERGTVAMARTNDPDSATSQFFINVRTNLSLDWSPRSPGYTVFAEVTDGMHVVDVIKLTTTGNAGPYQDVPVQPIFITEVVRVEAEKAAPTTAVESDTAAP